ncbi:hypothetical protein GW17_00004518 [Ensete ventricosum]|nr:hypothetical protein GW17_00004518 [Ensete ventricosum]
MQLLAKKLHPDTNKDADAERKFQEVQRAYEVVYRGTAPSFNSNFTNIKHEYFLQVLKDEDKRRLYDQVLRQIGPDAFEQAAAGGGAGPGGPFGGAGFGNPFEDIFGGGSKFNDVCTLLQSDLSVCLLNVER